MYVIGHLQGPITQKQYNLENPLRKCIPLAHHLAHRMNPTIQKYPLYLKRGIKLPQFCFFCRKSEPLMKKFQFCFLFITKFGESWQRAVSKTRHGITGWKSNCLWLAVCIGLASMYAHGQWFVTYHSTVDNVKNTLHRECYFPSAIPHGWTIICTVGYFPPTS